MEQRSSMLRRGKLASEVVLSDDRHRSASLFLTPSSVESHDVPAHTPHVLPFSVKQFPPSTRQPNSNLSLAQQYRSAHNRRILIQHVHRRLQSVSTSVAITYSYRLLTRHSDNPMQVDKRHPGGSIPALSDS